MLHAPVLREELVHSAAKKILKNQKDLKERFSNFSNDAYYNPEFVRFMGWAKIPKDPNAEVLKKLVAMGCLTIKKR